MEDLITQERSESKELGAETHEEIEAGREYHRR